MWSRLVRYKLLRKLRAIISLDAEDLKWSSFDQMFQKDSRGVRTVLLKSFQIAPAGKLVDCSILVELFTFCIPNDTGFWYKLHIDLNSLARKVHLFVRFWNIFRIWQLSRYLALTAKNTLQPSDRMFVAVSA